MNKLEKLNKILLISGYVCFVLIFILPANFMYGMIAPLRIAGLLSLIVCPIIAVLGLTITFRFIIKPNKFLYYIGYYILLFAFPIVWFIATAFNI